MSEHLLTVLALALVLDRFVGDPDWLWRRAPHPVVIFGKAISAGEKLFLRANAPEFVKRFAGMVLVAGLVVAAILAGKALAMVLGLFGPVGALVELVIVAVLLAQKSLADHVGAVASGLRAGGLEGGRRAVSMIVGRDPKTLDRNGVARAAIESLAESTSDGIVAPALFYAVFGLPGLFAYKLVNTADSMIGHRNQTYRSFGWAAARLDDLFNLVPSRLTGLIACLAFGWKEGRAEGERAFAVMRKDAGNHRSPNSGWPESAFAGGLGIALGGPRHYAGESVDEPFMHASGRKALQPDDIDRAIRVFWATCTLFTGLIAVLALLA